MKAPVYNQKGEKKGEMTLNAAIFGVEVNQGLMHQALTMQLSNARRPIAHTKNKGEVRGGGRKPFRQKGTGNARQGSIRNPHYRGGGVAFGPRNVRNYVVMMPKKQRRAALFSALSVKAKGHQVLVLDNYSNGEIKTKAFVDLLKKLPIERNVLVVTAEKNELIHKSVRNLKNAKPIMANYLNIKDLLKYNQVLFVSEDSLKKLEETFLATSKATPKKTKSSKK